MSEDTIWHEIIKASAEYREKTERARMLIEMQRIRDMLKQWELNAEKAESELTYYYTCKNDPKIEVSHDDLPAHKAPAQAAQRQ